MFVVMMYFGGVDMKIILGIVGVGIIGVGAIVAYGLLDDNPNYRILRLLAFMDPQKYWDTGGYQIIRSKQAIGSGLMTGKGTFLTGSYTTLGYVPEASMESWLTANITERQGVRGGGGGPQGQGQPPIGL